MKYLYVLIVCCCLCLCVKAQPIITSTTATLNDHTIHPGKRVVYQLNLTDSVLRVNGKKFHALMINHQIPAPTLEFTEGDTAYITVNNQMKSETSLHWHGILIPNQYDGVPYITTAPIKPHSSYLFIFPLRQTGTYWYHSHTMLEEQSGLYGPIVIHPQKKRDTTAEQVILFSDRTHHNPNEVLRMLKRQTDWFAIQKGTVQSYGESAQQGYFKDKLKQEWMRMPPMDISDVKYDSFLSNGRPAQLYPQYKPGQTLRLRLIDGGASTYFWVQFAGSPMTVVAADGIEVTPVKVDKLLMSIAETYDVMITIPKSGRFELRATAQDGSGYTSAYFGDGAIVNAPAIPKVPYFRMMHSMNQMMSQMKQMMGGMMNGAVSSKKVPHDGMTLGKTTNNTPMPRMNKSDRKEKGGQMQQGQRSGMDMNSLNAQRLEHTNMSSSQEKLPSVFGSQMAMDTMNMNKGSVQTNITQERNEKSVNLGSTAQMSQNTIPHQQMKAMPMNDMYSMRSRQQKNSTNMSDDGRGIKMNTTGSMMLSMGGAGKILTYDMLRAKDSTSIDDQRPVRTYQLYLTGSMLRYVWSINNKVLSEADRILIKKGERVRFVMHNTTMMEHPMHLHGHFFRVINAQGAYSPLKHTVTVEPMRDQTIEFIADEAHDWFFHCHILYHMTGGMARIIRYEDSPSNSKVAQYQPSNPLTNMDQHWFLWGEHSVHSQGNWGTLFLSNTRNEINADYRISYDGRYEFNPRVERYLDSRQYLGGYIGAELEDKVKHHPAGKGAQLAGVVGLRYLLPMLVQTDLRISHKGRVRFAIMRQDIPVTTRLRLDAAYNTDKEVQIETKYIIYKNLAISANYDNQYGFGGGLTAIY